MHVILNYFSFLQAELRRSDVGIYKFDIEEHKKETWNYKFGHVAWFSALMIDLQRMTLTLLQALAIIYCGREFVAMLLTICWSNLSFVVRWCRILPPNKGTAVHFQEGLVFSVCRDIKGGNRKYFNTAEICKYTMSLKTFRLICDHDKVYQCLSIPIFHWDLTIHRLMYTLHFNYLFYIDTEMFFTNWTCRKISTQD